MSTIRVDRITPYQSGSVAIEGLSLSNLTIDGTITASIQEGYVLVGGSGNVSTLAPTSSFGGGVDITSLNSFTASQEVLNTTFADTGSNSFIGNQTVSGSVTVIGQNRVTAVNPGVVLIHSGSSTITLAPNSLTLIHTESAGNSNIIGFSASPSHVGLANVNEPSIFTADSSSNYYQAIEFQSQGRFAENKVSFKVPVDVSGSLIISGSTTQVGNMVVTGSLTISGSSTFTNIGPTILSGSVNISGSINSDGYQLGASSTETIPALNSTFNLDFSGSDEGFGAFNIQKALVLGDGKVLIAGKFQSIDGHTTNDIARLNSNGTIDTSFTSPIFGDSDFGDYYGYITTFVTQSDGKIIVGGTFNEVNGSARIGLARLNSNGTLDTSFVTQSWGGFGTGQVYDLAIQNDNKIVVVGYFTSGSRRINTDGTLDTTYNVSTGSNNPSFFNNDYFYSVALLNSGSEQAILIGGSFAQWGSYSDYNNLVKLNPNGTLDFGFAGTNLDIDWNSDGWSTGDKIKKIKVTDAYSPGDNGYIYIAGRFKDTRTGPNVRNAGFARVTTEDEGFGRGAFDSGFRTYISGSDQNLPGVSVYVNDFDFYDSDKILLGGNFITFGIPGYSTTSANRFAIVNQNTGNLISGWAASGSASTYRLNTGSVDSVTLLPNDNVLVGGTFTSASNPSTAREGLASFKLTGFGQVTNTADYSITADTNQLLISSSNTYFSGDITASVISGSFVGDGSGLTGVIETGSLATTGSNTFVGNQNISGDLIINGNLTANQYIISSSVLHITTSFSSGSTQFGESADDTHQFTGSVLVKGNQTISGSLFLSGSANSNFVITEKPLVSLSSTAFSNTIIGVGAGKDISTGDGNVFLGKDSGIRNSSGGSNTFIGTVSGYYTVNSSQNSFVGYQSGEYNQGDDNTSLGYRALRNNNFGNGNVSIGSRSGERTRSGGENGSSTTSIFIGNDARPNSFSETNQIVIGATAIGNGSNTVVIGDTNITSTTLRGSVSASLFSGSFVGDGSGLTGITLPSGLLSSSDTNFTDFSQSVDTRIDNIVSGTGFATTSSFNELTQSFNSFTSSQEDLNVTFATTGSNTFIGNEVISGSLRVSGSISQKGLGGGSNIVIGDDPITNLTSDAQNNTVIGADAGALLSSGSNNVFIGKMAGILNQIGNSNVMVGTYAGYNAKGSQNVYIGESAGNQNISGNYNIAIGHQAGYNNKVNLNTFIGFQSGFQNTSGSANTFVGERSGEQNTIGQSNSFFGASAGASNSVGNYNTFIGLNTGKLNTSASFNTFVGSQAGYSTTTGGNNTFVGAECGFGNTTGYSNVFLGDNIGISVTTAYENTFIGSFSGRNITAGYTNTFVGASAGTNTLTGNGNTYIGNRAGNSNISGSNNTLVGKYAGYNITSGSDNTFFGKDAGYYTSNGTSELSGSNRSVFIGTNVKSNGHDETNQIVIGYDAVGNGSNTVTIGNNDITDTYVKGVLRASTAILAQVSSSYNFADDTAAQAGGVPLGGLYHTSGSIKIRLV